MEEDKSEEEGKHSWLDDKFDSEFAMRKDDISEPATEDTPLVQQRESSQPTNKRVNRTCCHSFFILISSYSSISLACLLISQFAPLKFVKIRGLELALRCYIGLFSIILLMAEMNAPFDFLTENQLLGNWISRGVIYSFMGLVNKEESVTIGNMNHNRKKITAADIFEIFQAVSSWMMVASGLLYAIMGLLCLRSMKDRCEKEYKKALKKEKVKKEVIEESNP